MDISQQPLCVSEVCVTQAGPFGDTEQDPEEASELDCGCSDLAQVTPALWGDADCAMNERVQLCPQAERTGMAGCARGMVPSQRDSQEMA